MKYLPQPCAEFPNDNPALHDGAVWACAWPRAVPRAVVRASATRRLATAQQEVAPALSSATPPRAQAAFEPWTPVLTPARTWAGVRPWCLDTELFDDDVGFPDAATEDLRPPCEAEPRAVMTSLEAALDEPLGEALPEVTATDPFVTDLWQDLERGWDAELGAGPRAEDDLSPAPVSELRLFQSPPREAAWNRLEILELDLSPLPPKLRDWSEFVTQVSAYLIDHGATRASVVVSSLLAGERVNLRSLRSAVRGELCAAGVAEQGAHDCYPTDTFRREASAFHELIVRRESAGSGALDWLGRLVFGLLGGDVPESEVRSALEGLGVNGEASSFEQDAPPVALPARAVGA